MSKVRDFSAKMGAILKDESHPKSFSSVFSAQLISSSQGDYLPSPIIPEFDFLCNEQH